MSISRFFASVRRIAQSSNLIVITAALVAVPASAEERSGTATVGGRFSSDMAEAYLSILAPLSSTDDSLLFLNPRLSLKDEGESEGNFGIGYRKLFGDKAILGANLYADRSRSKYDNSFNQWGIGLEFLTDSFDFRANYYNPGSDTVIGATANVDTFEQLIDIQERIDRMRAISRSLVESRTSTISSDFYEGNNLLNTTTATTTDRFRTTTTDTTTTTTTTTTTNTYSDLLFEKREGGLEGYDLELGYKLPLADTLPEVRVFGGYYDFDGPFNSEIKGAKGRLEVRAGDYLTFDAELFEDDELHGSDYYVGARLNLPFSFSRLFDGQNPFLARKDDIKRFRNRPLAARLGEEVLRDVNIHVAESDFAENIAKRETNIEIDVVEEVQVDVETTSRTDSVVTRREDELRYTSDGELITLTHVDSNSTGADVGTFEDPNTTLTSANATQAADANDIVLIHADSAYNDESIEVTDNQMVVGQGGGVETSIETDQGTVVLPNANGGTSAPVITNGGVNINSNNVLVTNLAIDGGSITTAANGEHSDLTITNMSIANSSGDAISLGDGGGTLSGTITLSDITITDSADDGIDIQNMLANTQIVGNNISITGAGDDGIDFDDLISAATNSNMSFTNVVVENSADAGITLTGLADGSTTSFANTQIDSSGSDGLRVDGLNAGATLNVENFDVATSAENGIGIYNSDGTITFDAASSIADSAEHGVLIQSGDVDLSYSGTIDHTLAGAQEVIEISNTGAASSVVFDSEADNAIVDTNLGIYVDNSAGDLTVSADAELSGLDGVYISGASGTLTFDNTHLRNIEGVLDPNGAAEGALDLHDSTATVVFGEGSSIDQGVDLAAVAVGFFGAGDNSTLEFNGTINATNGDGLQFQDADGVYSFNGTSTLNGGDAGIDISNGSGGEFTFENTAITNASGVAINIDGLDGGTVTFNDGSATTSSGSPTVNISNGTGTVNVTNSAISQQGTGRVISVEQFGAAGDNILFDAAGSVSALASGNQGVVIQDVNANVTLGNANIANTAGDAITIDNSTGQMNLSSVSVVNAGANGIHATDLNGTLLIQQGTTINGAVGDGIRVDSSGAPVATTVQVLGTADSVDVSNVAGNALVVADTTAPVLLSDFDTQNISGNEFVFDNSGPVTVTDGLTFADIAQGLFINQTGSHLITNADLTTLQVSGGSADITITDSAIVNNTNAATISVDGGHSGSITTDANTTIETTNGTGFQFDDADGTYAFNGPNTFNGGDAGIDIVNDSSGTFTFGSGTAITSPSGVALNIDGSDANVTYNGTITQNNAATAINIANNTGGTVTIAGQVVANTSNTDSVVISNNTSTTSFTGGLNLNTTSGTALSANNGGTVNISNGGDESITATNGAAVQIADTNTNIVLDSISANGGGAGVGVHLTTAGAGSIFAVSGTTQLDNYLTAILLEDNQGTATFGTTNIDMSNAGGARGIDFLGTNNATNFGVTSITNVGGGASQVGIDYANSTLLGGSLFTSVDISGPATSTDSVAVDLTAMQGNQVVRLGEQVRTGASSHITDVHGGVLIDNTAAVQFTFGDGEDATDTLSTIDVNSQAGAYTVDAAGGTLAASNFNFEDVMVGSGDSANLPAGANAPIFVSETGGTITASTNNLSDDVTTITVADAESLADTDQLFVFVGDSGGDIDVAGGAVDGFTLDEGQSIDSFNNGNTISSGQAQPNNITGNIGSSGVTYSSDDVTAINTAAGATSVINIDGAGNNQVSNLNVMSPTTAGASGVVVQNVVAGPVTLSNLTIDNGAMAAVTLSGNSQTINLNNVDVADLDLSGVNAGTALTITGASHAGQVVVGSGSDLGGTTGTVISANVGDNVVLLDTSGTQLNVSGNTGTVIDINGLAAGSNLNLGAINADGVTADSVLRIQNMDGGNLNAQAIAITNFGDATSDTAIDIAGSAGSLNFTELDIAATSGSALVLEGQTLAIANTDNDITTLDGQALNLDGTVIAAGGVTFDQVTANATTQDVVSINNTTGGDLILNDVALSGSAITKGLLVSGGARSSNVLVNAGTIANGVSIIGSGAGDVIVDADISAAAGYAVQVANRGAGAGVVDINGTVTSSTGAVSIQNNSAGTVQFDGVVTGAGGNTSGAINVGGNTGGTNNFNALVDIDVTGNGTGVMIGNTNTPGAAVNFNGGLDVNSVNGVALSVEGGTISVANAGTESVATTGTAGAVNIDGATVAASGINLDSVSTSSLASSNAINVNDAVGGAITIASVDTNGTVLTTGLNVSGDARTSNVLVNGGTINNGLTISDDGTGTVVVGAAITDNAGYAVRIENRDGSAGQVDINGAVSNNTGVVSIQSNSAGTVNFNGVVTGTGANTTGSINSDNNTGGSTNFTALVDLDQTGNGVGVDLQSGIGSSTNFTGGLDVTTASGTGVNVFEGGTVSITGASNSIATGSGRVMTFSDSTIGAAGLNFASVANTSANAFASLEMTNVSGGDLIIGTTNLTGSGVRLAGTIDSDVELGDVDIALTGDSQTGLDLSGSALNGTLNASDFDLTSSSATDTVGVNLVNTTGTGSIQLGDTNQNGGDNATITGVNDGVLFSSVTDTDFTFGDGSNVNPDGIASTIDAVTPINDNGSGLPASGGYHFNDVTLIGDTSALAGPDVYYVDAAGSGNGNTQGNAGSIDGAESSGADAIVLIDTTNNSSADVIDQMSVPHISAGLSNSLELADGQILITLIGGQVIDLGIFGLSGGVPSNFEINVSGSSVITGSATLDSLAPVLTTSVGDTVVLNGSSTLQDVVLTNTGTGTAVSGDFSSNETVTINTSTVDGVSFTPSGGTTTVNLNNLASTSTVSLNGSGGGAITLNTTGTNTIETVADQILNLDTVTLGAGGVNFASLTSTAAVSAGDAVRLAAISGGNFSGGNLTVAGTLAGNGLSVVETSANTSFNSIDIDNVSAAGISIDSIGGDGGNTGDFTVLGLTDISGTGAGQAAIAIANHSGATTFADININNRGGAGIAINGANDGTQDIELGNVTINNQNSSVTTGLEIADINAAGSTVDITSVAINNNGANSSAIALSNNDGATININGGNVQNAAAAAVSISNSSGSATYAGTINNSAGRSLHVFTNEGGGVVNITGAITDTGAGIVLENNDVGGDATINISGGMNLSTGTDNAFTAVNGGDVTVTGSNTISTTSGSALAIVNADVTAEFDSVTASALNGNAGIRITNSGNGTINVNGGSITNIGAGNAIDISGGSGSLTFATDINSSGATGHAVEVTTHTGGNVVFSGNLTDNGATGGSLRLQNNLGSTITFSGGTKQINTGTSDAFVVANNSAVNFTNGGLDIDTTTGNGFAVTGSGTVTVEGAGNTVTTTTGTAVNISGGTSIGTVAGGPPALSTGSGIFSGGFGVTFESINVNGATQGINLNNAGSGGFQITGTGTTAGSGGTIQNTAQDGIDITNTDNISLANVNLLNNAQTSSGTTGSVFGAAGATDGYFAALDLLNVDNIVLRNMSINGGETGAGVNNNNGEVGISGRNVSDLFATNVTVENFGNAGNEDNVQFQQLTGTVGLSNFTSRDTGGGLFSVNNTSGNLALTVDNGAFEETVNGVGRGGLEISVAGAGTTVVNVDNSTFGNGNTSLTDGGIQGTALSLNVGGTQDATLNVNSSSFNGANVGISGTLDLGTSPELAMNIGNTSGNTINRTRSNAINIFTNGNLSPGQGSVRANIQSNRIGTAGLNMSGSLFGSGISARNEGGGEMSLRINNNTIQEVGDSAAGPAAGFEGIFIAESVTAGTTNATITNNVIQNIHDDRGILVALLNGGTSCTNISGNTFAGTIREDAPFSGTTSVIRIRQDAGTHNVVQGSAAALATANGLVAGNITESGSFNYSTPTCVVP
ncbi:inverse autotransporter beta domain-containing protein [Arenicella xantha]|uniref:Inverse autotransporter-like protein with beta domain n=1 Tax=Arenicella xantha TaxID=644221 RepID=A0A395JJA0_9GAMM|nr:inverse autotransporter beta domain-containing protein [Arenicella xantha]RBP48754.1 inverse autotransporter-like protein with beta domain [Arenicella xantha]